METKNTLKIFSTDQILEVANERSVIEFKIRNSSSYNNYDFEKYIIINGKAGNLDRGVYNVADYNTIKIADLNYPIIIDFECLNEEQIKMNLAVELCKLGLGDPHFMKTNGIQKYTGNNEFIKEIEEYVGCKFKINGKNITIFDEYDKQIDKFKLLGKIGEMLKNADNLELSYYEIIDMLNKDFFTTSFPKESVFSHPTVNYYDVDKFILDFHINGEFYSVYSGEFQNIAMLSLEHQKWGYYDDQNYEEYDLENANKDLSQFVNVVFHLPEEFN